MAGRQQADLAGGFEAAGGTVEGLDRHVVPARPAIVANRQESACAKQNAHMAWAFCGGLVVTASMTCA
jgi:hypothetical protein